MLGGSLVFSRGHSEEVGFQELIVDTSAFMFAVRWRTYGHLLPTLQIGQKVFTGQSVGD